jgi:prolyl 4-hydroxylase
MCGLTVDVPYPLNRYVSVDRQCGPRILTFFLYLNDVEEGGGTHFPPLGLTVEPKRGRALLWPSIYNADPLEADERMNHEALPVEKGIKYAANGWIHLYDYLKPNEIGCT